jgi:hypothetical protein
MSTKGLHPLPWILRPFGASLERYPRFKSADCETKNTEIYSPSVPASETHVRTLTLVAKCVRTFLLFILVTSLMDHAVLADPNLAGLQWKKRVVVILAPSEDDPRLKSQRTIAAKASRRILRTRSDRDQRKRRGSPPSEIRRSKPHIPSFIDRQRRTYRCQLVNAGHFRRALFNHRRDANAARLNSAENQS